MFFKTPSPSRITPSSSPSRHTFSESMVEENVEIAESFISKWDDDSDSSVSLFSGDNKQEAKLYLKSVRDLQSAMKYFASHNTTSHKLVHAQTLMQKAMKRLQKEFYLILKANRQYLDAESVSNTHSSRASRASSLSDLEDESSEDDDFKSSPDRDSISEVERVSMVAMADLKSIADCMMFTGYTKECIRVYKIIRKSIVDEALYHLGVERLSFSAVNKMDWELLEIKIKSWLYAVRTAVKTLFYGERILCDNVFSASESIRESCFSEICKEGALTLVGFAENLAKCKKTPEKMFRTLDIYEAISDLWPEIESIFSFESTSAVRSEAVNALIRLGDAARTMLTDFETAIQKDAQKTPFPGGGVHPLTRYVMNYIAFLADYSGSLSDILADWPLSVQTSLPEAYFGSPESENNISSPISVRLAWLILVLLCKLDTKAALYKDVALSYLFLANNFQYVVAKVCKSNLRFLVGEDWITKHEAKVTKYSENYERVGWSMVLASLPENPTAEISLDEARNHFRKFNLSFEEAYKKQSAWVVPDQRLRDRIKISLARKLGPVYRDFYEKNRIRMIREYGSESMVRYAPDDLGNYLSDLFFGTGGPGSVSSSSTTSSTSSKGGRGRSR